MFQIKSTAIVGIGWLAVSCASSPPSSLVDARKAYQRASQGPAEQLAPAQLHAARTYLNLAEKTYDDEGDSDNARDRAYVAMRKAELAEVQARIARSSAELADARQRDEATAQREHVATEAELARAQAELAKQRERMERQSAQLQEEAQRRQQAEQAQQQALAALGKHDHRGTVITLSGSVIFPSGGSKLMPSATRKLEEVAAALKQGDSSSRVVIEGYTDSVGSEQRNEELSLARANAVREGLVARGVDPGRISIAGYGSARPVANNSTPEGRANNRRVEIVVQPSQVASEQGTPAAQERQNVSGRDQRPPEQSAPPPDQGSDPSGPPPSPEVEPDFSR